jgi:hypothetical protein
MLERKEKAEKPVRTYVVKIKDQKQPEYVRASDVRVEAVAGFPFYNLMIGIVTVAYFPAAQVMGITSFSFAD